MLHTSKTHDLGVKLQIIKIKSIHSPQMDGENKLSRNKYCPYQLLRDYLAVRRSDKSSSEPFFVFRDRSGVTSHNFRLTLKKSITIAGLDSRLYNSHGLCVGRAIDLFAMGVSVETIKKLGRWWSNAIYTNLR